MIKFEAISSVVELLPYKEKVVGSTPTSLIITCIINQ